MAHYEAGIEMNDSIGRQAISEEVYVPMFYAAFVDPKVPTTASSQPVRPRKNKEVLGYFIVK